MAEHNSFGKEAEEAAVNFLKENGCKILVRNYRFQHAEIDIIAESDTALMIVEVKARAANFLEAPHEAVNRKKMQLLCKAANHFAEEHNIQKEVRFDIISIIKTQHAGFQIEHLPGAFEAHDFS